VRTQLPAKRLLNTNIRLVLIQLLSFLVLAYAQQDVWLHTMAITIFVLVGFLLFPHIVSRRARQYSPFPRYSSPGSELLQMSVCGILLAIHFDAGWFFYSGAALATTFSVLLLAQSHANT
jgi:hypothetical protein